MNNVMSKRSSKGKLCGELHTNNLSSAYVEITYRYYFRGYVLFHGEKKLTCRGAKGCRRKSRRIKDQLLINKTVLKDCRKRKTNLAMMWISYRKSYVFVPHSQILECVDILGIADNVRRFLEKSMKKWKLFFNLNGSDLCEMTSIEVSSKEIACRP